MYESDISHGKKRKKIFNHQINLSAFVESASDLVWSWQVFAEICSNFLSWLHSCVCVLFSVWPTAADTVTLSLRRSLCWYGKRLTNAARKKPFTPLQFHDCETPHFTSFPASLLPLDIVNMLFLERLKKKTFPSLLLPASFCGLQKARCHSERNASNWPLILHFIYKAFTVVYVWVHGEHQLNFSGKYKPLSVPNMLFPLARKEDRTWVAKAKKERNWARE